eukprot:CAMPEP_0167755528 /NCGR_PEP_ID=MMETSP0110_2-20121227/8879_1 /TAXON_ID=629695 /ORGANISM="Gymnochlora sp., Strain CCMP2014" /LENGTH=621 /DNA_ID=CAMNT_0007641535 /DNA_START=2330 /DNA_END=4195 /DNA_ORIENTATION=+
MSTKKNFRIGDRVTLLKTGHHGRVAYEGKVKFRPGVWVGVVLERPVGLNNGVVKGVRYFECKPRYGIFVQHTALRASPLKFNQRGGGVNADKNKSIKGNTTDKRSALASPKIKKTRSNSVQPQNVRITKPTNIPIAKTTRSSSTIMSSAQAKHAERLAAARQHAAAQREGRARNRLNVRKSPTRVSRSNSPYTQPAKAPGSSSQPSSSRSVGHLYKAQQKEMISLRKEMEYLRAELQKYRKMESNNSNISLLRPTSASSTLSPSSDIKMMTNNSVHSKNRPLSARPTSASTATSQSDERIVELEEDLASSRKDFDQAIKQLQEAKQSNIDLKSKLSKEQNSVKELEERLVESETSREADKRALDDRLQKTKEKLSEEAQKAGHAQSLVRKLEGEIKELKSKLLINSKASVPVKEDTSQETQKAIEEKLSLDREKEQQELQEYKMKVESMTQEVESLSGKLRQRDQKMNQLIDAAESHANKMQERLLGKQKQIESLSSTSSRLKSQLTDAQKKANKLVIQNKRLRMKQHGKHSAKQGKTALAQFGRLDQKIKDLQYQLHYGESAHVQKMEALQMENDRLTYIARNHRENMDSKTMSRLKQELAVSKYRKAESWLFAGNMEVV